MIYQGKSWPIFTGSITEEIPTTDERVAHAVGAQQLHGILVTDMVTQGVTPPEMIYVLARSSGIRQERLKIDGIESLPSETFEVIAPLDGVTTRQITEFARIAFLQADIAVTGDLEISDMQRAAFTAPAYARASVTASMMLEAEEKGLAAIDFALAWLTAQLRCGTAMLPLCLPKISSVQVKRHAGTREGCRRGGRVCRTWRRVAAAGFGDGRGRARSGRAFAIP